MPNVTSTLLFLSFTSLVLSRPVLVSGAAVGQGVRVTVAVTIYVSIRLGV